MGLWKIVNIVILFNTAEFCHLAHVCLLHEQTSLTTQFIKLIKKFD